MLKRLIALPIVLIAAPALACDVYLGRASMGEQVWYHGAKAQCGDLPASDPCWKNPMAVYKIGRDNVTAIVDCKRQSFKEVWVGGKKQAGFKPQSKAVGLVVDLACALNDK